MSTKLTDILSKARLNASMMFVLARSNSAKQVERLEQFEKLWNSIDELAAFGKELEIKVKEPEFLIKGQ